MAPLYVVSEFTVCSHVVGSTAILIFQLHHYLVAGVHVSGKYALPARTTLMHEMMPAPTSQRRALPDPCSVEPYPVGRPSVRAPAIQSPTASEVAGPEEGLRRVATDGYESEEPGSELGDEALSQRLRNFYEAVAHRSPGQEGESPTGDDVSVGGAAASGAGTDGVLAASPAGARASGARASGAHAGGVELVGGAAASSARTDGGLAPSPALRDLWIPIWKVWHTEVTESLCFAGVRPGEISGSAMKSGPDDEFLKVCAEAFNRFVSVETIRALFLQQASTDPSFCTKEYISIFERWLGVAFDRWFVQDLAEQHPKVATKLPVAASPVKDAGRVPTMKTHVAFLDDAPMNHELRMKLHEAMTTVLSLEPFQLERLFFELDGMRPGRRLGEALRAIPLQAWEVAGLDRATVVPLLVASRCSVCEDRLADAPMCPNGCLIPLCRACALYWYRNCPVGRPRCPGEGCEHLLTVEELRAVGFGEAELAPWHAARVPAAFEGSEMKLVTCASGAHLWKPTAHCPNAVAVCRSSRHPWACPCGAPRRCTGCGDLWHPAVSCEKLARLRSYWRAFALREEVTEERIRELQKDEEWKEAHCKLCPKCGAVVERRSGCADMVCGRDADDGANKQAGCGEKFRWDRAPPYRSAILHQVEDLKASSRSRGQLCKCGEPLEGLSFSCVHCEDWHVCFACFSKLRKIHNDFLAHPDSHVLQPFRGESQSSTAAASSLSVLSRGDSFRGRNKPTRQYPQERRESFGHRSRSRSVGG